MDSVLFPDTLLLTSAFAVLGLDLFRPRARRAAFLLAWAGPLLVFALLLLQTGHQEQIFWGGYAVNGRGFLFKQFFALAALFTILLTVPYFHTRRARPPICCQGEFHAIILFATCGMFLVVSAVDLLTLLVGMEIATIPLYALCGFRKGCPLASEAAAKYVIMGGISTAMAVFGYSLLYGGAGSLRFDAVLSFASRQPDSPLLLMAVLFILAGAGFKLALCPFHMWAPDVYQGAPLPVTAFLSVSSKATAVSFLAVLFFGPLAPLVTRLTPAFLLLAAITMTAGNLGAMKQTNLLRFMAYSSIAQAGYMLLAFVGRDAMAQTAAYYYLLVYGAANFVVFFIIAIVTRSDNEEVRALRGLSRNHPALAALLMLSMFSLAGIPPLAGFTGKFMLFAVAAREGYYWMVLFAALNSTISLYYYLLLIKEAYIVAPEQETTAVAATTVQTAALLPLAAAMLLFGILPSVTTLIRQIIPY